MIDRGSPPTLPAPRRGGFQRRLALIFALQLAAVVIACLLGFRDTAPPMAVIALIVIVSLLAWLATQREWRSVSVLARVVSRWNEQQPDLDALEPERLPHHADADVVELARGLHAFASRIAGYNQRERNFTRDASHELRSPLTIIKMSTDMLADESGLGESGQRSLRRIRRATRELESVVEALLILARESDNGQGEHEFVVNDVLRRALDDAREGLHGRLVALQLDEPARFALHGSPRVFAVLCGQLIRYAGQHAAGQGKVVVTVLPGAVTVGSTGPGAGGTAGGGGDSPQGFELAIAQRISERFAWPLDWPGQGHDGAQRTVRVRFPRPLPAKAAQPGAPA
ncbi:histidine kinase dimerization/phospho-acceptor domain-containing protein [Fulvimonas sp. R45]|uniref:sensor histidine kinase n=1 Tax=Fulvimonas sp. R45 TaxID=3045937 RepID=UPI00265DC117|nr:histidine kinase dimerization/phospho-acceptor domain-containing protein [Fulvimonas sp. R45]MDO1529134.1 histidine kinase dimerization/phospho-acceptor domain-containing protein [Fulvimonas sp. R45]